MFTRRAENHGSSSLFYYPPPSSAAASLRATKEGRKPTTELKDALPSYAKLSQDIHLLGDMLGQVIIENEGERVFALEEQLRRLSKIARRAGANHGRTRRRISEFVSNLSHEECLQMVHSFSVYFQLVNLLEDRHRERVLRKREAALLSQANHSAKMRYTGKERANSKSSRSRVAESAYDLIFTLQEYGFTLEQTLEFFKGLRIELVFTAHPNEARRRTVIEKSAELQRLLFELDTRKGMTPFERSRILDQVKSHVTSLWQTDEVRNREVSVMDEVKIGLHYLRGLYFLSCHWSTTDLKTPWHAPTEAVQRRE